MGGCGGYVVGGWLDQVGIRLSQLLTKLKLKLKLKRGLAISEKQRSRGNKQFEYFTYFV